MKKRTLRLVLGVAVGACVVAAVFLMAGSRVKAAHVALALAALGASFAVYLVWGVIAPVVGLEGTEATGLTDAQRHRLELLRDKDMTVQSLRELEFDRATGKVGAADYAAMRADLEARGIKALKALDAEQSKYERSIEAEVRGRLRAKGVKIADAPAPAAAAGAVADAASAPGPAAPAPAPAPAPASAAAPAPGPVSSAPADGADDVFAKIERLADLLKRGAITAEEFDRKKQELLSRI